MKRPTRYPFALIAILIVGWIGVTEAFARSADNEEDQSLKSSAAKGKLKNADRAL